MTLLKELQVEIATLRRLEKAQLHVIQLKKELDKDQSGLTKLELKLDDEYKDYEKLEGKSLKGFFYQVLGNKEQQLEKERQEYLQLSLQYDGLKESIKLKQFEIKVLAKKVLKYKSAEKNIERLMKKREAFLLKSTLPAGHLLRDVLNQLEFNARLNVDMQEAIQVGEELTKLLEIMIQLLRTARNWGRWDRTSSNSRQLKYKKYTNIDRAKQIAYQIQHKLKSFNREVNDVYPNFDQLPNRFDLDRFNGFTDLFFDNLISDWIVQQKIVNSLNNVKSIFDRVHRTLNSINLDQSRMQQSNDQLEEKREKIILGELKSE